MLGADFFRGVGTSFLARPAAAEGKIDAASII
jgi:hypothetical protein